VALQTIDNLILEIVDRLGGRGEVGTGEASGAPPAGRVERALNDALQHVALAYKLPQFEADPPWYFKSTVYQTGTAACSLLGTTITGVATTWVAGVMPPQNGPTGTVAAGGAVTAGTHSYRVTFVTAAGETLAGPVSNTVTTSGGNLTVNLTGLPISQSSQVTSRRIYRTAAGNPVIGPWLLVTTIANNTATTYADTTADGALTTAIPAEDTANSIGVGWLFKFNNLDGVREIVSVASTTSLVVTPRVQTAQSGAAYTIIQNQWQMPTASGGQTGASPSDVFAVIDVRDAETQVQINKADTRVLDKSQLATGNPEAYTRYKDKLFLWPAPDAADIYYRVRYMQRPEYRAYGSVPAKTLYPLPEEWQEVVVLIATGKALAAQMSFERAAACIEMADAKAKLMLSPYAEESEDNNFGLKPSGMWLRGRD